MAIKYDNTKGFKKVHTEIICDPFEDQIEVTGIEYGVEHPVIYVIGSLIIVLTLIPGGVIVWNVLAKSFF